MWPSNYCQWGKPGHIWQWFPHFNKFGASPATSTGVKPQRLEWGTGAVGAPGQGLGQGSSHFFPFPASIPGKVSLTALMPRGLSWLRPRPREVGKDPQCLEPWNIKNILFSPKAAIKADHEYTNPSAWAKQCSGVTQFSAMIPGKMFLLGTSPYLSLLCHCSFSWSYRNWWSLTEQPKTTETKRMLRFFGCSLCPLDPVCDLRMQSPLAHTIRSCCQEKNESVVHLSMEIQVEQ